ncbi:MAG: conjugal transfer protein TraF [Gammaproteobacteria bacterium]
MFKRKLIAAGLLATAVSNVHALPYGFYDARSVAMGNVSMATGGITTAALSNPGMLAVNESDDGVALLLPAIGVQAIDDGNVVDLVDEFQATSDPFRQVEILNELDGASLVAAVVPNAAFVYSGDSFTWGIALRGTGVISAALTDIDTTIPPAPNTNNVTALGVGIQEIGIPLGSDFKISGIQVSVGITPRYVQVDSIEYKESIQTADIDDILDTDSEDLGSFTTVDAGITINLIDTFRVGLVAKNLIEETKTTTLGNDVVFDTHYRVGAAVDLGVVTLAADMDLTERDPIAFENPSKSLSVGAEIDAFKVVQLRAGYQTNLADNATDPDLLSLGVGIWLGFHLDIAAVVGEDSSYGAFLQTGFHF